MQQSWPKQESERGTRQGRGHAIVKGTENDTMHAAQEWRAAGYGKLQDPYSNTGSFGSKIYATQSVMHR